VVRGQKGAPKRRRPPPGDILRISKGGYLHDDRNPNQHVIHHAHVKPRPQEIGLRSAQDTIRLYLSRTSSGRARSSRSSATAWRLRLIGLIGEGVKKAEDGYAAWTNAAVHLRGPVWRKPAKSLRKTMADVVAIDFELDGRLQPNAPSGAVEPTL
jgi:hypothetical protein